MPSWFKSTGEQEWQLWQAFDAEDVIDRQVQPALVQAIARNHGARKVIVTAFDRHLVSLANALCKSRRNWPPSTA